jgi:hypothetical protein
MTIYNALFEIMSLPELKEKFETKINYDLWKEEYCKVLISVFRVRHCVYLSMAFSCRTGA